MTAPTTAASNGHTKPPARRRNARTAWPVSRKPRAGTWPAWPVMPQARPSACAATSCTPHRLSTPGRPARRPRVTDPALVAKANEAMACLATAYRTWPPVRPARRLTQQCRAWGTAIPRPGSPDRSPSRERTRRSWHVQGTRAPARTPSPRTIEFASATDGHRVIYHEPICPRLRLFDDHQGRDHHRRRHHELALVCERAARPGRSPVSWSALGQPRPHARLTSGRASELDRPAWPGTARPRTTATTPTWSRAGRWTSTAPRRGIAWRWRTELVLLTRHRGRVRPARGGHHRPVGGRHRWRPSSRPRCWSRTRGGSSSGGPGA